MEIRLAPGDLLAAHPELDDPNFARTLILVCQHDAEGAFGLVLNRRTELTIGRLLPDHPVLSELEFPVHLGGPVDHGRIHFVHTVPGRIRGGSELRPGLWIGGELDDLAAVLAERAESKAPVDDVRIFLGYAGWGESQLDAELAANSWLPVAGRDDWIWCPPGEEPWRAVLRSTSEGEGPPEPHEAN